MHVKGFDLLLWASSFVGHVVLLIVLIYRRRARVFPAFTSFIAAAVLRTIILFCVQQYGTKAAYFYTYWSLAIVVDVFLQMGVVIEVFLLIFRFRGHVRRDVRPQLLFWTIGSVLGACIVAVLAAPDTQLPVQRWMIRGNLLSSALMSELLAGMVWLAVRYGFPMKTHVARICEGFGVYSLIDVGIEAAHTYFGLRRGDALYIELSHFRIAVYLACLGYWVVTLWRNVTPPPESTDQVRQDLSQIAQFVDADLSAVRSRRLR
jgi:hypothetical protein